MSRLWGRAICLAVFFLRPWDSCPWAVGSCAVIVGLLFDLLWFGDEWRGRVSHGMEVCELSCYCCISAERFIEYFEYLG